MSKPKINTNPVSAHYGLNANERRIEFSGKYGGGLINFIDDDGRKQTRVEVYRQDPDVDVTVSGHTVIKDTGPNEPTPVERALAAVLDYMADLRLAGVTSVAAPALLADLDGRISTEAADAVARWRVVFD